MQRADFMGENAELAIAAAGVSPVRTCRKASSILGLS
jgi:hypothetical protein